MKWYLVTYESRQFQYMSDQGANERIIRSASLAFVRGILRWPVTRIIASIWGRHHGWSSMDPIYMRSGICDKNTHLKAKNINLFNIVAWFHLRFTMPMILCSLQWHLMDIVDIIFLAISAFHVIDVLGSDLLSRLLQLVPRIWSSRAFGLFIGQRAGGSSLKETGKSMSKDRWKHIIVK